MIRLVAAIFVVLSLAACATPPFIMPTCPDCGGVHPLPPSP